MPSPLLLQFGGSLVAILALAGLARWLGLGGTPRLATAEDVRRIAGELVDGFACRRLSHDREGAAALVEDAAGRVMLIKRHGNRFAGRILGPEARARLQDGPGAAALVVDCGEPRFGKVILDLPDQVAWAQTINAIGEQRHA